MKDKIINVNKNNNYKEKRGDWCTNNRQTRRLVKGIKIYIHVCICAFGCDYIILYKIYTLYYNEIYLKESRILGYYLKIQFKSTFLRWKKITLIYWKYMLGEIPKVETRRNWERHSLKS